MQRKGSSKICLYLEKWTNTVGDLGTLAREADPVRPQGCEVANSVSLGVLRESS